MRHPLRPGLLGNAGVNTFAQLARVRQVIEALGLALQKCALNSLAMARNLTLTAHRPNAGARTAGVWAAAARPAADLPAGTTSGHRPREPRHRTAAHAQGIQPQIEMREGVMNAAPSTGSALPARRFPAGTNRARRTRSRTAAATTGRPKARARAAAPAAPPPRRPRRVSAISSVASRDPRARFCFGPGSSACRPSSAATQPGLMGHTVQAGRVRLHTVAPKSMMAWV